jgi:hypothetical protein
MIAIQMNGEWRLEDLGAFVEPVEIYDAKGKFVGLFVPANMERGKEMYARAAALRDPVELDRRRREEKGGRPLREAIEEMQRLEAQSQSGDGTSQATSEIH